MGLHKRATKRLWRTGNQVNGRIKSMVIYLKYLVKEHRKTNSPRYPLTPNARLTVNIFIFFVSITIFFKVKCLHYVIYIMFFLLMWRAVSKLQKLWFDPFAMCINTCMLILILLSPNIAVYLQKEGVKQAVEAMERVYGTKYNFGNHANTICKCIRCNVTKYFGNPANTCASVKCVM